MQETEQTDKSLAPGNQETKAPTSSDKAAKAVSNDKPATSNHDTKSPAVNKAAASPQANTQTDTEKGDRCANYLVMVGHICADINQGALSAILPFLVVGSGYTYFEATMLLFAANIASAVIQPLFGWLGDKKPAPWFMALGVFLAGLGMAGIGYMPTHPLVLVSAMISGIGIAMFHPEGGRLSNLAAGKHKGQGMSIFGVGGNVGFFIGPVLCATFLTAFGLAGTAVFLVPACACALLLIFFNKRFLALGSANSQDKNNTELPEHWGLFSLDLAVLSLRSVLGYGLMAFIPLFLVGMLGQSESFSSGAISVYSIAGAVATFVSGRVSEKYGSIKLMIICCLVMGIGIVAFSFSTIVAVALIITVIIAIANNLFYPSAVALGMQYVPRHLGMASGLSYGITVCVGGVAEPFLGMAGDAIGLVQVMLILAAISFVATIISLILLKCHKNTFLPKSGEGSR